MSSPVFWEILFMFFCLVQYLTCHIYFLLYKAALPLEFPDGTTPVTCRVSIYDNSSDKKVGVGKLMDRASVPPLPTGSLYMEEVHVKVWLIFIHSCSPFVCFNIS